MKRTLVLVLLALAVLLLALGAWAVEGLRWAVGARGDRRPRPVTA